MHCKSGAYKWAIVSNYSAAICSAVKATDLLELSVIFDTPGRIYPDSLQGRDHQAGKEETIGAQQVCGVQTVFQIIAKTPRRHCCATPSGSFAIVVKQ